MRRIGTVIVLAIFVVLSKFGGIIQFSWPQLRIVGELALIWLVYDLVRSPVTQFIHHPAELPDFSKMMAIKTARVKKALLRIHLKSGEMREGYVTGHSFSRGSFTLGKVPNDYSCQQHYQASEVDELIVDGSTEPILEDDMVAESTV